MRHTTFRFTLDPTPEQVALLARHAGASRFAYNQCLRFVTEALASRKSDPSVTVPWSSFDLINAFNTWKRSGTAGRVFVVTPDGIVTERAVGLTWRREVSAQVFEEAAVDLGHALAAYAKGNGGTPKDIEVASQGQSERAAAATASACVTGSAQAEGVGSGSAKAIRER
jgi:putative transposase